MTKQLQTNNLYTLREVFLTKNISLREVLCLNNGFEVRDGKFPEGEFGIYYQVALHSEAGSSELTDFSGYGLYGLETIAKFFVQETKVETFPTTK